MGVGCVLKSQQNTTITGLGKIRPIFELRPLMPNKNVPTEAVERLSMAMNVVQSFCSKVEAKRNESEQRHPSFSQ